MPDATTNPALHLPLIVFDEVSHVGTLNTADRKDASYEGDGLSVSVHPEDWAFIARLGHQTWAVTAPDSAPLRFVDWYSLTDDDKATLRTWGLSHGWLRPHTEYRAWSYDSDLDAERYFTFDSQAEAEAEVAETRDCGDDTARVEQASTFRPTASFPERRVEADADPTDMLLVHYLRTTRPDVDGVWWEETYDPAVLSCPRGVLVHSLDRYTITTA